MKKLFQSRKNAAIETIYEASTQLLEVEGEGGFTTNHIAERAGYSIGTLYRYFPNKRALLQSLIRSISHKGLAVAVEQLAVQKPATMEAGIRILIHTLIQRLGMGTKARRFLYLQIVELGGVRSMMDLMAEVRAEGMVMFQRLADEVGEEITEPGAFLAAHIIQSTVQQAIVTQRQDLTSPAFEDALVLVACTALRAFPTPATAAEGD